MIRNQESTRKNLFAKNGNGQEKQPKTQQRFNGSSAAHPQLATTIQNQIVPKLVSAHRHEPPNGTAEQSADYRPGDAQVTRFADLILEQETTTAWDFVQGLRRRGVGIDTIYLDLFTPTARQLGDRWADDTATLVDVAVGLSRLQEFLHELSPSFVPYSPLTGVAPHRILLIPIPGEQHSFGLLLVAEFFRQAGWDAFTDPVRSQTELNDLVRREAFSVIGYSVSADSHLQRLASSIQSVRRHTCNSSMSILVGGRVFIDQPGLAAEVGADDTAIDARDAVAKAQALV